MPMLCMPHPCRLDELSNSVAHLTAEQRSLRAQLDQAKVQNEELLRALQQAETDARSVQARRVALGPGSLCLCVQGGRYTQS